MLCTLLLATRTWAIMNKDDLKSLRRGLAMTQADFGEWLSQQINTSQDKSLKPVAPYSRQRVAAWEGGDVVIPAKVELVFVKRQLEEKSTEVQKLRQRRKQKQ